MALTNLLTTQNTIILQRFGLIMLNILESLNDISKIEEDGTIIDSLVLVEGQSPSDFGDDEGGYYETDHDQRKVQLIMSDPIHTVVLRDYLQSQVCILLYLPLICTNLHLLFLYLYWGLSKKIIGRFWTINRNAHFLPCV